MIPLGVEKVQAVLDFFAVYTLAIYLEKPRTRRLDLHIYCVFMSGVFQDELFEVEKSSFVRDLLAKLYDGSPGIGRETLCTIWTLVICNNVFNLKGLLEDSPLKCFLLDGDFYFNPPRMWFRPDKAGVYDSDL